MSEWAELISAGDMPAYNIGLSAAREETLVALLGRPVGVPDNKACYNNLATKRTALLTVTRSVGPFKVTGIRPAVESLAEVLSAAKLSLPKSLFEAIGSAGMLCVRKRRPTSGRPTELLSAHSWGTAIDIAFDGQADTTPDGLVQRGIAAMIPFFNAQGWYAGAAFKDDTHFEVAEQTLHAWAQAGAFNL